MTVKDLIKLLIKLDDLDAVIDMSGDEEGNSYSDIDDSIAQGKLIRDGQKVFTLYPVKSELPEDRYIYDYSESENK